MYDVDYLDLAAIEKKFEELSSSGEQIKFLKWVKIKIKRDPEIDLEGPEYESGSVSFSEFGGTRGNPMRDLLTPKSKIGRHIFHWVDNKLKEIIELLELESEDDPIESEQDEPRTKPLLSAAQCCLVMHYLLHVAEMKTLGDPREDKRHKEMQRLVHDLSGHGEETVRKRMVNLFSRKEQTPKDLRLLKPYFENLGVSKIVELIDAELTERGKSTEND